MTDIEITQKRERLQVDAEDRRKCLIRILRKISFDTSKEARHLEDHPNVNPETALGGNLMATGQVRHAQQAFENLQTINAQLRGIDWTLAHLAAAAEKALV